MAAVSRVLFAYTSASQQHRIEGPRIRSESDYFNRGKGSNFIPVSHSLIRAVSELVVQHKCDPPQLSRC